MLIFHREEDQGEGYRAVMSSRLSLGLNGGAVYSLDELDELAFIWQEHLASSPHPPVFDASPHSEHELTGWQLDMYGVYGLFSDGVWWEDDGWKDKLRGFGAEPLIECWLAGVPYQDVVAKSPNAMATRLGWEKEL